jgi:hypothetical protein
VLVKRKRLVIRRGCRTGFDRERRRRKDAPNIGVRATGKHVVTVDHPHDVPASAPEGPRCQIREQPVGFTTEPPCWIYNQARGFTFELTFVHSQRHRAASPMRIHKPKMLNAGILSLFHPAISIVKSQ